jgi:hypothetical protein
LNYTGIFGFDISTYQDAPSTPAVVDFAKMRDYGGRFVIVKAGQGNWEDPDFDTNWRNAKGILPRASYWYYDNRYSPKEQARKYFDTIRQDLEGMCWLDLEDKQAGIYSGYRNWYDFCEELKLLYPAVRIGIYSGFYYIVEMFSYATTAKKNYFVQFPLWLANYQPDPFHPNYGTILIPLPWLEYLILQSGTPAIGPLAGVESLEIDYNQFNGDAAKFEQYFGSTPQPPTEGNNMPKNKVTILYPDGARERQLPHAAGTLRNILPAGTVHYSDFDEVPDMDAPTNTNMRWIKLQSGWFVASLYPATNGINQRARVEPVTVEPAADYVADFDVTLTAPDGKQYAGTVAGLRLREVG